MALSIDQIMAASYPAVLTAMRKPANQWSQNSLLDEFDRQKMIERKPFGSTLEETLDYRRNPGGGFLATDMTTTSLTKTEVLTAASYAIGEIAIPITWSEGDETKNPTENQKVNLVKSLVTNGIDTHDNLIEEALFSTVTNGFLGFQNVLPDNGEGTPGGIDAGTETFWRNVTGTYLDDGTDIESALTAATISAGKGSGSKLPITLLFGGAEPYSLYMGALQSFQRFIDTKEADGGFKQIAHMTARFVASQFGGTRIYGVGSKSFKLSVSSDAFRKMLDKVQVPNAVAWNRKIYSACQLVTNNKSRGFVLTQTT
jgi:hypothetical protein